MKKKINIGIILACVLQVGCVSTTVKTATAQHVPCTMEEIEASSPKGLGAWTWTAECKGVTYSCSGVPDGSMGVKNSSCKAVE